MSWLGLLLTAGGFVAYFAAARAFALFERVPWAFLGVMGLGVALALAGLARAPRLGTAVGAALTVGVFGFACWYLFSYSMFGAREARPAVGDPFPAFGPLPTSRGGTFRLEDARGSYLLLLFYRGAW